jgi:hypothetical protein
MKRDLWLSSLVLAACGGTGTGNPPVVVDPRAASLPVGPGSADLHVVDVDGDGHLDLVSRHLLQNRVVVTRGDGAGGFAAATARTTPIDDGPGAMGLADLDGDGAPDLVVATRIGGSEVIEVLIGRRDGTFRMITAPSAVHARAQTYKPQVFLLDVDEDGAIDVVTANGRRSAIEILRGDGRGHLAPPASLALPPLPEGGRFYLAVGDLDGDRHVDFLASLANEASAALLALRGDGAGGFAVGPVTPLVLPGGAALEALADLDGDGDLDAALTHDARVTVLANAGDGTFAPAPGSPFDVDLPAYDIEVADVDGDGRADLVVATVDTDHDPSPSRVVVLRGAGAGGFARAPGAPYIAGPGAFDVVAADVDADGRTDLAASSFGGDAVTLVLGAR